MRTRAYREDVAVATALGARVRMRTLCFYYIFSHNNCEVNKISKNDFTQGKTLPKMIKFIIAYNVISSIFRGLAAPAATVFGIMINLIYYIIYTKRTDKKQKLLNNVN